jgi:hypothetical protein
VGFFSPVRPGKKTPDANQKEKREVVGPAIDSPQGLDRMTYSNDCRTSIGDTMRPTEHTTQVPTAAVHFNFAKLQATACILASAAVSIGLTYFALTRLL